MDRRRFLQSVAAVAAARPVARVASALGAGIPAPVPPPPLPTQFITAPAHGLPIVIGDLGPETILRPQNQMAMFSETPFLDALANSKPVSARASRIEWKRPAGQ